MSTSQLQDKPTVAQRLIYYGREVHALALSGGSKTNAYRESVIKLSKAEYDAKCYNHPNGAPSWVVSKDNVIDGEIIFLPSLNQSNTGEVKSFILAHFKFCKTDDIGIPLLLKVRTQLNKASDACCVKVEDI